MKKILILSALLFPLIGFAQKTVTDSISIEQKVDEIIASWNNHDYSDMANYATEDCDWVNIKGMWWKGRKEVEYAHQVYHQTIFKTSVLKKNSTHIRFITKDVAIVHLSWRTSAFTTPSGNQVPEGDDLATLVFVKKSGKWLLTAAENVDVVEASQKNNPVLKMPKS
ncbi:MAG: hypothetical protein RLY89_1623 [Bacteroidota bacterium]|jgi:uncharacterized protein (TIGR02246 family)